MYVCDGLFHCPDKTGEHDGVLCVQIYVHRRISKLPSRSSASAMCANNNTDSFKNAIEKTYIWIY